MPVAITEIAVRLLCGHRTVNPFADSGPKFLHIPRHQTGERRRFLPAITLVGIGADIRTHPLHHCLQIHLDFSVSHTYYVAGMLCREWSPVKTKEGQKQ